MISALSTRSYSQGSTNRGGAIVNLVNSPDMSSMSSLKSPSTETESISLSSGITHKRPGSSFFDPKKKVKSNTATQMKLCGNSIDPNAGARMDVAITDFLHSHLLPFSLAQDPKLIKIIDEARKLGPLYTPPNRNEISGKYLDALYSTHWKEQMKTLISEAHIFGITIFGDGATVKTIPLFNILAAGVNNPFALLDIADCTGHLAEGGKKDAKYIAKVIMPLIQQIESEEDILKRKSQGTVDLVFFDGASNVQNAGEILRAFNPRITVGHGAEHVVSLFFSDVYTKVKSFKILAVFAERVRNIFGSVRHAPSAMFKKYTRMHNNGVHLGFVKPSECRMAGKHIAILRLLRLKNALLSTINSKEFIELRAFQSVCQVLMNPDFWKWTFVMCRALYAPMRVLRLADQQTPAMDKLHYYVLQTDRMLEMYVADAEERGASLLTSATIRAMDCSRSAHLSDESVSDFEGNDGDNNDNDNEDDDDDDDDSVMLSAQNNNNDSDSSDDDDDDDDEQVFM
jgi:hypothetical protein